MIIRKLWLYNLSSIFEGISKVIFSILLWIFSYYFIIITVTAFMKLIPTFFHKHPPAYIPKLCASVTMAVLVLEAIITGIKNASTPETVGRLLKIEVN